MTERQPTHPGVLLREDVFPSMRKSVAQVAKMVGVSRQYLSDITRAKKPMTTSLCFKIGKLVGNGPALWANMQTAYDIWEAQQDKQLQRDLKKIPTLEDAASF